MQKSDSGPVYVCEVLANLTKDSARSRNSSLIRPQPGNSLGEMQVRRLCLMSSGYALLFCYHSLNSVCVYLLLKIKFGHKK